MEQAVNEQHNPEVQVHSVRRIAIRGLIPGHEGSWVDVDGHKGELERFYHRGDGYTEVRIIRDQEVTDLALPHLTEIGIRA